MKGGEELEGVYTGRVEQHVKAWMFTLPLQATYRLAERWQLRMGPYLSVLTAKSFDGNVSDGYLRKDFESISDELAVYHNIYVSTDDIGKVLIQLQSFDPPGIGARTLQECLLLQVDRKPAGWLKSQMKRVFSQHFDAFLKNFFLAIHSRYDIEKPVVQRFIRRKLGIIHQQKQEIEKLNAEITRREELLRRLAVEYTLLGKECEQEHMTDAAIRNYQKALELCPDTPEARRRLKKLQKK